MAANRKLFVELGVNDRKLAAGLRKSEKKFKNFGRKVGKALKKSFSMVKLAAGAGLGFALASVGKDVFKFEDTLDRLSTQARLTASQTDALRDQIVSLSKETGVSRNVLVGAAAETVNLGLGAKFASDNLGTLAKAYVGTGSAVEDLVGLQFTFANSFGILDIEGQTAALNAYIAIGDLASIPINRMASAAKEAGAAMKDFGDEGEDAAVNTALAMQALNKEGFATADLAKTGIRNFAKAASARAKALRKFGIETFEIDEDGVKGLKKFNTILEDIASSELAKDPELLREVMGSDEAFRATKGLINQLEWMKKIRAEALSRNAIDEAYSRRQQSVAGRIQKATNRAKEALSEAFTPERIEKFVAAIEKLADVISIFIDNLGAVVALWVAAKFGPGAASLAFAGGSLLGKTGIGASINAAKTGALGAKGMLGAAGMLTAALGVGVAFGTLIDDTFDLSDKFADFMHSIIPWNDEVVARAGESNRVSALQERLDKGEITQEEFAKGKQSQEEVFAFRGVQALTSLIADRAAEAKGVSFAEINKAFGAKTEEERTRLGELSRQVLVAQSRGDDTTKLVDQIASAIAGTKIHVTIGPEQLKSLIDKTTALNASTS